MSLHSTTYRFFAAVAAIILSASCIRNDIPYPVIELAVTAIEADGTAGACRIDPIKHTVVIPLDERTDIRNVKITRIAFTEGAHYPAEFEGAASGKEPLVLDLRAPKYFTLGLYQDYDWTIEAEQNIERYFTVKGQIGATEFDLGNRTATAWIRDDYDLRNVTVESLKLGPKEISEMSPSQEELSDFSSVRFVDVAFHGRSEQWNLYVLPRELTVEILDVMEGVNVAWITVAGVSDADTGLRYRRSGQQEEWSEAPAEWIHSNGGNISVTLRHLQPETTYEIMAYADDNISDVQTFTTSEKVVVPNCDFEQWHMRSSTWYPYPEGGVPFWGSGNDGSSIAGVNVSLPCEDDLRPGTNGKVSAHLVSANANVVGIKKFAAGNIYTGYYAQTIGANGLVDFGRPFTVRPAAFRVWVKYRCGTVNSAPATNRSGKELGEPDEGIVYVALGDWDPSIFGGSETSPVRIDTRDISTFFSPQKDGIIGYGEKLFTSSCDDWTLFEVPIEYRSARKPTHIIIVCTSSRLGDYFVGSDESEMWVDDFELLYDLD